MADKTPNAAKGKTNGPASDASSPSGSTSSPQGIPEGGFDDLNIESGPPELIMLREWIRSNQTTALVGAFAVGSLIGYWLKK